MLREIIFLQNEVCEFPNLCPFVLTTLSSFAKTNRKQNESDPKGELHMWLVFPLYLQHQMRAKGEGHWRDVGKEKPTETTRCELAMTGSDIILWGLANEASQKRKQEPESGDKGFTIFYICQTQDSHTSLLPTLWKL